MPPSKAKPLCSALSRLPSGPLAHTSSKPGMLMNIQTTTRATVPPSRPRTRALACFSVSSPTPTPSATPISAQRA